MRLRKRGEAAVDEESERDRDVLIDGVFIDAISEEKVGERIQWPAILEKKNYLNARCHLQIFLKGTA